jgi:predicted nucleotidyltransferase component of viral defense system
MTDQEQFFATQNNPSMAEKDYLECKILEQIFHDPFFANKFVFAGGGSITKSYSFSPRIGQDVDLAYNEFTDLSDTRSKKQLNTFRKNFKSFVFDILTPHINAIINKNNCFNILTDREQRALHNQEQWLSSPTIHIFYQSKFNKTPEDIRIEIIPRKYPTENISFRSITPYSIPTMNIGNIPTIAYEQTFWITTYE